MDPLLCLFLELCRSQLEHDWLATLALVVSTKSGIAFDLVNSTIFGVAIKGYDTVAYHTEGRAVKGSKKYSYKWNDAKWYFSSTKNRDLFAANPDRFAPQSELFFRALYNGTLRLAKP